MRKLRQIWSLVYTPNGRRRRQIQRSRCTDAAEVLESRQLLSATTDLSGGVLQVQLHANGRAGENLVVTSSGGNLQVGTNRNPNAFISASQRIPSREIQEIHVTGSHRRDRIVLRGVNKAHFPNIQYVYVDGGSGNDVIHGSEFDDILYGRRGKDRILGFGGNDHIYGGLHGDTLLGGDGADWIYGQGGNDYIAGNDTYKHDKERDMLFGGADYDTILKHSRKDRHFGIERFRG